MYIVVNEKNIGVAKTDSRELAFALASDLNAYVKLFADWKGPNKADYL